MLTDRQIQSAIKAAAAADEGREFVLNDGAAGRGTGSLRLVIRRNGDAVAAVWFAAWKQAGRRSKKSLGRYPGLSLKDARDKFATEIRPALSAGKNPRAVAPTGERPTVAALFDGYLAQMTADGCRSVDEVRRALMTGKRNAADALGRDRLAGTVEAGDVSNYLAKIYKRGARVMADRARSYLHAAFQWGAEATNDYRVDQRRDWGIGANPVATVPRDSGATRQRDRALSAQELGRLWREFGGDGYAQETVAAVRLLIVCGQRVRETLRARGADFDLGAATWSLPNRTTKGGKPHRLPIPPQAVEIVRQLRERNGDGLLFPARTKGARTPHISDGAVARALRRWCTDVGANRFQTRDLRRTWKSRCGDAGVDKFTRDLLQQHAKIDTSGRVYDHADYFPQMRRAMIRWGAWLGAAITTDERPARRAREAA